MLQNKKRTEESRRPVGRNQFGALAGGIIAGILKTTPDKIKVRQQMLGGGYRP